MSSAFAMWRKSLSQLVMMDSKSSWELLDPLSKWFIATRSAVTTVTLYSGLIAGLLAWQYLWKESGFFNLFTWLVMTLGLFIAHGTNNLMNDYVDFKRGIDTDNYFRTQYGVHPLAQGFWTKRTHMRWFVVSGILALLSAIYAMYVAHFTPLVVTLVGVGSLLLLTYTYPLKYVGIGELSIFTVWGPLMIGGIYYVLTGHWSWNVFLASVPVGLSVASINVAKHTDKMLEDRLKKVRTLPVLLGERAARYIAIGSLVLPYLVILYLVFFARFFSPVMLLVAIALDPARKAIARLSRPRPLEAPEGYPLWPRWFSTVCFLHNRRFSNYFVLGLIADTALRTFLPQFWR